MCLSMGSILNFEALLGHIGAPFIQKNLSPLEMFNLTMACSMPQWVPINWNMYSNWN